MDRRDAPGTLLALSTAGDVETLVRAHGTRYVVTNPAGDIAPAGARELGLFADDTRYLSHYTLSVRDLSLVHLSSDESDPAENRIDLMVSGAGDAELLDDPQHFLWMRRRQLVDGAFRELVQVVNYLQRRVELDLVVAFDADFADVFEVRGARRAARGTLAAPEVRASGVDLAYRGRDAASYVTRLRFSPQPTVVRPDHVVFHLSLSPGASTSVAITVEPHGPRRRAPAARSFDEAAAEARASAERFAAGTARFRCDHPVLERVLAQSALDLHALSIDFHGHRVLAAGIPWFSCPFGRDTLISAYEALTLTPDLAISSLRGLAELQGRAFDDVTEEEPGKILHELRSGEMAACREIPHVPYYGTIDATPLFVVVAHATYEVTGDAGFVRELAGAVRAALGFIDRRSDQGTSLVTYARKSARGLDNQGWKDSRAGVSFPDGRRAVPPIALAEVQGYCVDAYRRGAELLAIAGDADAEVYRARAERFARVVDDALWLEEERRYAFAVDGGGRPLPTVVSNLGHLLWSRVPDVARARATADLLLRPASFSAFGIRTLAADQPVYNPLSYHNGTVWPHDNALIAKGFASYELMDEACRVLEAMLAAMDHFRDHRLPELFCGIAQTRGSSLVKYPVACSPQAWASAAPFLLLQAALGLHIDGPRRQLLLRNPRVPSSIGTIAIDGLRVGPSRVSLRLRRVGHRCHVDRLDVTGEPVRTFVELE